MLITICTLVIQKLSLLMQICMDTLKSGYTVTNADRNTIHASQSNFMKPRNFKSDANTVDPHLFPLTGPWVNSND